MKYLNKTWNTGKKKKSPKKKKTTKYFSVTQRLQQCLRLDMDMEVTLGFSQMNLAKRKNSTLSQGGK